MIQTKNFFYNKKIILFLYILVFLFISGCYCSHNNPNNEKEINNANNKNFDKNEIYLNLLNNQQDSESVLSINAKNLFNNDTTYNESILKKFIYLPMNNQMVLINNSQSEIEILLNFNDKLIQNYKWISNICKENGFVSTFNPLYNRTMWNTEYINRFFLYYGTDNIINGRTNPYNVSYIQLIPEENKCSLLLKFKKPVNQEYLGLSYSYLIDRVDNLNLYIMDEKQKRSIIDKFVETNYPVIEGYLPKTINVEQIKNSNLTGYNKNLTDRWVEFKITGKYEPGFMPIEKSGWNCFRYDPNKYQVFYFNNLKQGISHLNSFKISNKAYNPDYDITSNCEISYIFAVPENASVVGFSNGRDSLFWEIEEGIINKYFPNHYFQKFFFD